MQRSSFALRVLPLLLLSACGMRGTIDVESSMVPTAGGSGSDTTASNGNGSSAVTVDNNGSNSGVGGTQTGTTGTVATASNGSSGATSHGGESWVWVYANWQTSLQTIGQNPNAFTHISPTFYSLNYNYTGGVAYYSNCPFNSGLNCSANGTNNFGGMTTAQFTAQVKALGMQTVPAIYAGAANNGMDQGVQRILANTGGAQTSFIAAMVTEAVNNGYNGYNLDFEMGSGVTAADANAFVTFVNAFKAALAPHGMSLSVDAIVSNINGSWCSSNNGYLDFGKLSKSAIDRVIIEDYTPDMGTPSNQCQTAVLSSASPAACPVTSNNDNVTAVGLLNYMCSNLPSDMIVIGLESYSTGSNPIAGEAVSTMQSYGLNKVAIWPQIESGYPFLSANSLSAAQNNWYSILSAFLAQ